MSRLHPRELRVLAYVAQGYSDQQIAARLCVSVKTVHRHVANLRIKLGLTNRTLLARYAWQTGLVDPAEAWHVVDSMRHNTVLRSRGA